MKLTGGLKLTVNGAAVSPCQNGACEFKPAEHWAVGDMERALGRPLTAADVVRIEIEETK